MDVLSRGRVAAVVLAALAACTPHTVSRPLVPLVQTAPVTDDADDPAIWVSPDGSNSLVLGTNKAAAPTGALVVFGLDGRVRQTVAGLDRPNNVDVEYGVRLGGEEVDIAVLTERRRSRLRAFRIPRDGGPLVDISSDGGLAVFATDVPERREPMGVALYKRPRDGAVFAIVSRKTGSLTAYLWQYRLEDDGHGRLQATKVRELGTAQPGSEIEAVAVDDALGYVYYAEERVGIHKWQADPDHPDAGSELALFAREGFRGDREGIAIDVGPNGGGHIVCTDQVVGGSRYHLFPRQGTAAGRHDHPEVAIVEGGADETDGLDMTAQPLGERFPHGLVVAMNSGGRNFFYYRADEFLVRGQVAQ